VRLQGRDNKNVEARLLEIASEIKLKGFGQRTATFFLFFLKKEKEREKKRLKGKKCFNPITVNFYFLFFEEGEAVEGKEMFQPHDSKPPIKAVVLPDSTELLIVAT
jgi:hypothetical protein